MKLIYLEDLKKFANEVAKKVIALIPQNFIISGSQTATSDQDGGTNVYTFTDAAGSESTFKVKNGSKGSTGAAGPQGATGQRGSRWNSGTAITGTSTTAMVFSGSGITDALVNDYYLNTSTGYVYRCTVAGAASAAKWVYAGSIKGATGATGASGSTASVATTTSNGLMSADDKKKLNNIVGGNDTSEITDADIDKIINGTYTE